MRKFIKNILITLLFIAIIFSTVVFSKGYDMYKEAIGNIDINSKVEKIRSDENYVTIDKIPKDFMNAVVSIEDKRFFKHSGFDIVAFGRAILVNIQNMDLTEGGSTLTQQLAKNMYFTQEKRFTRKVSEVLVAKDLEKMYSKEQIFELYANVIYFGNGYYGIGEASRGYFSKEPNELTLDEITILAGIPNAPSVYALNANPDLARKRQIMVINAMYDNNFLDITQVNSLVK